MSSSSFFTKNITFANELSTNQSPLPGIGGILGSDNNGVFKITSPPQPPSFIDGLTLQTDISSMNGVKWGTPSASSVTLTNAGTGMAVSLVEDGTGPDLETRGLLAGTGIGITQPVGTGNVILENTSPASSVSLANAGTGMAISLVEDGAGPDLETRGLLAGTGIDITQTGGGNVTLATNADASVFEYSSGNVISNTSNSNYNVNANMVFGGPPTSITNTQQAVILGGNDHTIMNGNDSVILGGNCNIINGADAAIVGGDSNTVTGENATSLGGNDLTVTGDCSCCIAGDTNAVNNGQRSVILGGGGDIAANTITSSDNAVIIGGGTNSIANANNTVITGGTINSVSGGNRSVILGGTMNNVQSGNNNVIFGGDNNTIDSGFNNSMIGGQDCNACHSNVFMWGDGQASTTSIDENSVTFRCCQGMRIFTTNGGTGVSLGNGDTSWGVLSDRNQKENIVTLDDEMCREIAEKFMKIDLNQYNYKETPKEKICYGPMAQDWHGEFRCENVTEPKLRKVSSGSEEIDGDIIEVPVLDEKGEPVMITKPAKNPLTIPTMDMIGILMTTVRHLYKEIDLLKKGENRSSEHH